MSIRSLGTAAVAAFLLGITSSLAAQAPAQNAPKSAAAASQPVAVSTVKPRYPSDAMRQRISGTATLGVDVRADGSVGRVVVVKSLEASLDREAIKAVRQWRFKPGTRNGKPVAVRVNVDVSFTYK
jgi:periplasmic protein TonB